MNAIEALRNLERAYVGLLQKGYERIIDLGGSCDPVEVMANGDPALRAAREALSTPPSEAPKLPKDRCDSCDNGIEPNWTFCPWCGLAAAPAPPLEGKIGKPIYLLRLGEAADAALSTGAILDEAYAQGDGDPISDSFKVKDFSHSLAMDRLRQLTTPQAIITLLSYFEARERVWASSGSVDDSEDALSRFDAAEKALAAIGENNVRP